MNILIVARLIVVSSLLLALASCGGGGGGGNGSTPVAPASVDVAGGGVKGPLVQAAVEVYAIDFNAADLRGSLLGAGSTNDSAAITGLTISADIMGLVIIDFISDEDTLDITSNAAPIYDRLVTVVDASRILSGDAVYATPLTTMAVNLARQKADKGAPYAGNSDNVISEAEFLFALTVAQGQVKSTLGFGANATLDIFTVPPLITSASNTAQAQTETAVYRQANEALAAMTAYVADNSAAEDSAQDIFNALTEDLQDGTIDGASDTGSIATLAALDVTIASTLSSVDPGSLLIPGTDIAVRDIENVLVNEKASTQTDVDTTVLETGAVDVEPAMAVLESDIDGDGVADGQDAFPFDPNEAVDSDDDGVGDNADVFPNDPAESTDSDSDGVGDNADAFPRDDSETVDSDGDGIGDNSDAFPNDPTETADSDGDQVGDNTDVFPQDPTESTDSDSDGVGDNSDAFPSDPTETSDRDGDQVGDNTDAYPDDPTRSLLDSLVVSLWIGNDDTEAFFPGDPKGVDYYRSTEPACDISNYTACGNGQLDVLIGLAVTDTATQLDRDGYHRFVTAERSAQLDVGVDRWIKRDHTAVLSFNDRMWVIAGNDGIDDSVPSENSSQNDFVPTGFDGFLASDVWSSQDGDTWVKVTENAAFGVRSHHAMTSFQGKMWLVGGSTYNQQTQLTDFLNDVWTSTDGRTWTQVTSSADFPVRREHALLVYDNKLWVMGGTADDFTGLSDVWYSENGIDWTEATADAGWPGQNYPRVVNFNNQLMLIGGGGLYDKIWTSINGADWTEQQNTNFPARNTYSVTVHGNQVWVTCGYNGSYLSDVWSSEDGLTYTQVPRTDGHFFSGRSNPGFISFKDQLWILGGRRGFGGYADMMSSPDGASWFRRSFGPEDMPQRASHELVAFNNKLFNFAGMTFNQDNSIWSSEDGLAWQQETAGAAYSYRYGQEGFVFNNKLWLLGGMVNDGENPSHVGSDIWSSEDGVNWVEETSDGGFGARTDHRIVEWNGKLWLIGGSDNTLNGEFGDVWSSTDGVTWVQEASNAAFQPRTGHSVFVFQDRLWVMGGHAAAGTIRYEDVWSSSNGVDWTEENLVDTGLYRPRGLGVRFGFETIVFNGKIFVISGYDSADELSDIWSSSDGVNWTQETADSGIPGRSGFGLTLFDNQLWLQGGVWSDGLAFYQKDVWKSDDGVTWRVGLQKDVSLTGQ